MRERERERARESERERERVSERKRAKERKREREYQDIVRWGHSARTLFELARLQLMLQQLEHCSVP